MSLWTARGRRAGWLLAATLVVVRAQPLEAQARLPQMGERVRLTLLPDSGGIVVQVIGTVGALGGDTLVLLPKPEQSIPIPVALIDRIDGSVFHQSVEDLQSRYAITGALAGSVLGVSIGASMASSRIERATNVFDLFGLGLMPVLGGAVAASVGAVLGRVLADHQDTERWAPLAVPALSTAPAAAALVRPPSP